MVDRRFQIRYGRRERFRLDLQLCTDQLVLGQSDERLPAGQQFIQHARQAVEIASLVALMALYLFWSDIVQCSDHRTVPRQPFRPLHPSDPEIRDLQQAGIVQHQIRRLDVAMDDSDAVGIGEPGNRLRRHG
jgi:hypothetical protein